MKVCPKCEDLKALSEFQKNCTKRDGRQAYCRTCQNALMVESRKRRSVVARWQVECSGELGDPSKVTELAPRWWGRALLVDSEPPAG